MGCALSSVTMDEVDHADSDDNDGRQADHEALEVHEKSTFQCPGPSPWLREVTHSRSGPSSWT